MPASRGAPSANPELMDTDPSSFIARCHDSRVPSLCSGPGMRQGCCGGRLGAPLVLRGAPKRIRNQILAMTLSPLVPDLAASRAAATDVELEKTPLERYVPPAKPSLVGLSREALAQALGCVGVPERQRDMRGAQIWHWVYVRGAQSFEAMSRVS